MRILLDITIFSFSRVLVDEWVELPFSKCFWGLKLCENIPLIFTFSVTFDQFLPIFINAKGLHLNLFYKGLHQSFNKNKELFDWTFLQFFDNLTFIFLETGVRSAQIIGLGLHFTGIFSCFCYKKRCNQISCFSSFCPFFSKKLLPLHF